MEFYKFLDDMNLAIRACQISTSSIITKICGQTEKIPGKIGRFHALLRD